MSSLCVTSGVVVKIALQTTCVAHLNSIPMKQHHAPGGGIIRHPSTIHINYRKWLGPSINTTDPLHSEFQVWSSSVAWFWSYSLPKISPNISTIGQFYVLSDSIPYLFSKSTFDEISAALGSSMTLLLQTNSS